MGMSIDKAIDVLEYLKTQNSQLLSLDVAIDTMRKYQKIEQIYKEWFSDKGRTSADAYVRIGEVLEDGNDD